MKNLIGVTMLATALLHGDAVVVKEQITTKFPQFKDAIIEKANMGELYQVLTKDGVLYTDGKVWMFGNIMDFEGKNLSKRVYDDYQRKLLDSISKEKIDSIDLSKALKFGDGKHKVIVITDPQCDFCRALEEVLSKGDITKYVFMSPLPFHEKGVPLSENIICRKGEDQKKTYNATYKGLHDSLKKRVSCTESFDHFEEGRKASESLGFPSTRPLVIIDGKIFVGLHPKIAEMIK